MIPAGELQFKQAGKNSGSSGITPMLLQLLKRLFFLPRITQGPFDPEVIQSEYSIKDQEIKVR